MHSEDGECRSECCCLITKSFFATLWTVASQVLLSTGFSRKEYWGGLSFPSPEDHPNLGIKPVSPAVGGRFFFFFFNSWATWEVHRSGYSSQDTESESHSVGSDSLWPHELDSPWNASGQNTGVGSLSLLWGSSPTQGSNPGLPHCRLILYQLSQEGSPILEWVAYPFSSGSFNPEIEPRSPALQADALPAGPQGSINVTEILGKGRQDDLLVCSKWKGEDSLEKGKATHSSILAWRIPGTV